MRKVRICYIPQEEGEEPLLLLTPRQKKHLAANIVQAQKRVNTLKEAVKEAVKGHEEGEGVNPDETERLRTELLLEEVKLLSQEGDRDNDALLRETARDTIEEAVFEFRAPDLGDRIRIQRQVKFEQDALGEEDRFTPDQEVALAVDLAFDLLKPEAVSGWEGDLPLSMKEILAEECYLALYPQQSVERALFLILSPENSSSTGA